MEACNPNAQNIEPYINAQYLCDHFDEYGISLKRLRQIHLIATKKD